jgi:hypothetical protein
MSSSLPASWSLHDVFSTPPNQSPQPDHTPSSNIHSASAEDLEQDLEDSLEELSEGIDVLQILERAYDKTLRAHVISSDPSPPLPEPASSSASSSTQGETNSRPLLEGSSTALLAVLDHPPRQSQNPSASSSPTMPPSTNSLHTTTIITSASSATPLSLNPESAQTPLEATTTPATSKVECELVEESEWKGEYDAVIKIAHVGDCMGMLVRGEDIVWRSEEMWWDVSIIFG